MQLFCSILYSCIYKCQCWKFLSPGRPRRSDLGLGDLFSDVGSPGGRPKMAISQLLLVLQTFMTTRFAVQMVVLTHYKRNILGFPIDYHIKWSLCVHQGYLSLNRATWLSSQVAHRTTARLWRVSNAANVYNMLASQNLLCQFFLGKSEFFFQTGHFELKILKKYTQ